VTSGRLTVLIIAVAVVSIVAVVISQSGGDDRKKTGASKTEARTVTARTETAPARTERTAPATTPSPKRRLPSDPEAVLGNDELALQRPRNLRRALRVLERQRQRFEGVFDDLRIAPGRIDTTIERADRRRNVQIRGDLSIPFSNEFDFPTGQDILRNGLRARDVDVQMPRRILNAIDLVRAGSSATRDLDYMVVRKDIIDHEVSWSAYLQSGPRPRQFSVEGGKRRITLRAIG
jgi:hypothetical protein